MAMGFSGPGCYLCDTGSRVIADTTRSSIRWSKNKKQAIESRYSIIEKQFEERVQKFWLVGWFLRFGGINIIQCCLKSNTIRMLEDDIIAISVLGVVFIVGSIVVERRVSHPLIAIGSMSAEALFIISCVALGWASFGIWVHYYCEFLLRLHGQHR